MGAPVRIQVYNIKKLSADDAFERQVFRVVVHIAPKTWWQKLLQGKGLLRKAMDVWGDPGFSKEHQNTFKLETKSGTVSVRWPIRDLKNPNRTMIYRGTAAMTARIIRRILDGEERVKWVKSLEEDQISFEREMMKRLDKFYVQTREQKIKDIKNEEDQYKKELRARSILGDEQYEGRIREGRSIDF